MSERCREAGERDDPTPLEVRPGPAPVVLDAMTREALGLAVDDGPAAGRVTDLDCERGAGGVHPGPDERHDGGQVPVLHLDGGHAGRGHAGADHPLQVLVRDRRPEPALPQVDRSDRVAGQAVAHGTLAGVEMRSLDHVGLGVLTDVFLAGGVQGVRGHGRRERQHRSERNTPHTDGEGQHRWMMRRGR